MNEKKENNKEIINSLSLSSLGINLVVATAVGLALGIWLDGLLKIKPILTIFFFFLGIVSGFINIFKEVKRINDDPDVSKKNK